MPLGIVLDAAQVLFLMKSHASILHKSLYDCLSAAHEEEEEEEASPFVTSITLKHSKPSPSVV